MVVIKTDKLWKSYRNLKQKIPVLRGVDLIINKGDFVSILGPSGSGKTTLLYVLSGIEDYNSGYLELFNKDYKSYNNKELRNLRQKRIGFVFQSYNLISHLTVYENILLSLIISNKENKNLIDDILENVGLLKYKHYYPNQLSGGMQQRVAIARCLANDADIIFADEPTGNLDYNNGIAIMEIFKELNIKYQKTVIMVTHNEEMIKYGNRCIRLKDGKVLNDDEINK